MYRLLSVGFVAILACFLLKADAGEKAKTDEPMKLDPAGETVKDLSMAFRLAEYGRTTKSPEALITAAGILQRTAPATLLKVEVMSEDGKAVPSAELPSMKEEAANLLKEAKELAKGDATMIALADAVANRADKRGSLGGPSMFREAVRAGGVQIFKVPAVPGKPFVINFQGQASLHVIVHFYGKDAKKNTSMHVVVYNYTYPVGHTVFVPPANLIGGFRIEVHNPNNKAVTFTVATN